MEIMVYILVFYCIGKYQQHDEQVPIKEYFSSLGSDNGVIIITKPHSID